MRLRNSVRNGSECQKFLARKPFECSYNFHEAQTFAIARFFSYLKGENLFRPFLAGLRCRDTAANSLLQSYRDLNRDMNALNALDGNDGAFPVKRKRHDQNTA